jgi:ABC-type phosphate transport system auxiliary subunit
MSPLTMALLMSQKLSSRQQAQLALLQTLPPKFHRMQATIEEMGALRADEVMVRGLARQLDELRVKAQGLNLGKVAESAGLMAMMARRSGGLQVRVRGLRELLANLKINYDTALREATTPGADAEPEAASE